MKYLSTLKRYPDFNSIINQNAQKLISFYAKSFSHRLLRTTFKKRKNQTVLSWVKKCKGFADLLIDQNTFNPSSIGSVKIAILIDSNILSRKTFFLFKKIYKKSIL